MPRFRVMCEAAGSLPRYSSVIAHFMTVERVLRTSRAVLFFVYHSGVRILRTLDEVTSEIGLDPIGLQ